MGLASSSGNLDKERRRKEIRESANMKGRGKQREQES